MIDYLSEEEIVEINRVVLEISNEYNRYVYDRPDYVRFILNFVAERFGEDLYKKALAYCIGLIVTHPFRNGNHRVSMISAEHFLLKNNFTSFTNDEKDKELYKWRIELEHKDDYTLQRQFFNIECDGDGIEQIMNSEYGIGIECWLKNNYKQRN
jgi:prophage maintenance system killer protein